MDDFRTVNDPIERGASNTSAEAPSPNKLLEDSGFAGAPKEVSRPRKSGDIVPDRYIVKLNETPLGKQKDSGNLVEDKIAKVLNRNGILPQSNADTLIYKHAITGFAANLTAAQKQALQNDPDVAFIEQDKVIGIKPINVGTPHLATQHARPGGTEYPSGVLRIEGDKSPTANAPGNVDVDIAVLDTGINLTHSDLNVVQNVSFIPGAARWKGSDWRRTRSKTLGSQSAR